VKPFSGKFFLWSDSFMITAAKPATLEKVLN